MVDAHNTTYAENDNHYSVRNWEESPLTKSSEWEPNRKEIDTLSYDILRLFLAQEIYRI